MSSSGREFVSGSSVDWGDVGLTIIGSILWLVSVAIAEFVGLIESGVLTAITGLTRFVTALVTIPFDGSVGAIGTAWESAGSFVSSLGIAAFPVAVLLSVVFIAIMVLGVRNLVN